MAIRTILVPTDFSNHSSAALDHAIELARELSARIVLLHSYWVAVPVTAHPYALMPAELLSQMRDGVRAELEQWAKRATQAGVACEVRLSADTTTAAILDAACDLPADLIVIGTHGHTGVKHALLGSTAERIVRLAPCPVLSVKAAPA